MGRVKGTTMSTELVQQSNSDLAIASDQTFWSDKQLAALRQIGVENASNGDLAVFFHQVTRTGLDPFARQIYMIVRKEKGQYKQTIQTGIDGFRLIARRASDQRGEVLEYEDTLWCGPDGQWVDVWLKQEAPAAAKVTVIRGGGRFPAVALFHEYAGVKYDGGLTKMWATKGALMLAKCAEALALRKAFPQDLSGLYTSDELQQADDGPQQQNRPVGAHAAPAAPECPIPADFASKIDSATNVEWLDWARGRLAQHEADWPDETAALLARVSEREQELAAERVDAAPAEEAVSEPTVDDAQATLADVLDAEVVAEAVAS